MRSLMVVVALALAASACGGGTDPLGGGGGTSPPLGTWQLTSAEPSIDVPGGSRITLTVEQDDGQVRVGGTAACNQYGGTLRIDGQDWQVDELFQTEMGCEPSLMEAESAYITALAAVDTWSRSDDTLQLMGDGVTLVFEFVPEVAPASLAGTTWEVDGYVHGSGDDGAVSSGTAGVAPATLRLDEDGTVTLFTGCRDFTGAWTTSGDELVLQSVGEADDSRGVAGTGELACHEQAIAQEQAVLEVVQSGATATIEGQQLTLMRGDTGLLLRATE